MVATFAKDLGSLGGYAGGALGGAGGGTLLGALGRVLEPLDYPRQALWNLARSTGNALSGQGNWDDALRAIPGALGAGLAGGLMATGVGAPLGILAGSALGGLGQGIGKAIDQDKFAAPEAKDITGTDDFLPNMLVNAIGDPLTYAGGLGGASRGAEAGVAAGAKLGSRLDEAAQILGPNYKGGMSVLDEALANSPLFGRGSAKSPEALERLEKSYNYLANNQQALRELEPGSQYIGHGAGVVAFQRPDGGVTVFGRPSETIAQNMDFFRMPYNRGEPPLPRPDLPEMVPAYRSAAYPGAAPIRVEHVPYVEPADSALAKMPFEEKIKYPGQVQEMISDLNRRGIDMWDPHRGNLGFDPQTGQLKILDADSVVPMGMSRSLPRVAEAPQRDLSSWESILVRLLGGPQRVRQQLAERFAGQGTRPLASQAEGLLSSTVRQPVLDPADLISTAKMGMPG